ncbi:MAG TPA: L-threonylcarbamoyladenylate synthase, partial [Myxococcaceae bacterium]|nr:L-threonylcarbamoyladenylate synthase [Myxococcaceae bacterium]
METPHSQAAEVLRRGGLVALPTETVYGLGADARNEMAVRRIFAVKGRPSSHPLIVHLADAVALGEWAREVPNEALALARAFWPGPLTVVLPRAPGVLDVVT